MTSCNRSYGIFRNYPDISFFAVNVYIKADIRNLFSRLRSKKDDAKYFSFGSSEDHYKYREAVKKAYPAGNFPVFSGYDHMQYQIQDPKGFAALLRCIVEQNTMPELPFLSK